MEEIQVRASFGKKVNAPVHSWDTQTRRIRCGAPGQTGSTKHARDVTCVACRERMETPGCATLQVVPQ